jgi:hypothetical protein
MIASEYVQVQALLKVKYSIRRQFKRVCFLGEIEVSGRFLIKPGSLRFREGVFKREKDTK